MQFRILGPPDLFDEERRLRTPLTSPKQNRLLGALLSRPNSLVPREELVRELWAGRAPKQARSALNAHVSGLRKSVATAEGTRGARARLVTGAGGLTLRVSPTDTDGGRFCLAVSRARSRCRTAPEDAYGILREALSLWRGAVLEGVGPHGPLGAVLADRLQDVRRQALELLFDAALSTGRHADVLSELREATVTHPLCERFHDQLMLALCRSGRGGEAIGVYTEARCRLTAAHGHTPLLRARLEQIGAQSPELSAAGARTPAAFPPPRAPARRGEARPHRFMVRHIEREDGPAERSALGFLTDLLSGRELHTGGV
ncbi:AfsR/SARP family transcriptional regulator [Streptomyces sp. NPDC096095]|uniref:AfsR/SARP family transcriptional regulator n=1 Tax=Streptomyces sp. NPDC096095 TaxID=3155545 RepID=UPI00332CE109